ncbi:MAG: oligogalacturonate lyase family protein [Clostridia bacterium]|nr:oligogalacturonate lyase family protein [Clostridia bacterium]
MELWGGFKKETDKETGRELIRITDGDAFCYPLYYFIPSITDDGKYLVYHRMDSNELQIYSLELATGKTTKLTDACYEDTQWRPWCSKTPPGILDHRSVLDSRNNRLIYFDGNKIMSTPVDMPCSELLKEIPADRTPIGQNCVTPDGKWFVYIHHDRESYKKIAASRDWNVYYPARSTSYETIVEAYNLDNGNTKEVLRINSPVHHIFPYGNEHFVINHPVNESGMIFTHINGGWYTNLRTKDSKGRMPCHNVSTSRGIAYEAYQGHSDVVAGITDPFSHIRKEFHLPDTFGYVHTGHDHEGRLFFYENMNYDDSGIKLHNMYYLESFYDDRPVFRKLLGHRESYIEKAQKAHFHPRFTPDREQIVFTGGCFETKTNHIYFLDAHDLDETKGFVFP